jgi:hypothetical protein
VLGELGCIARMYEVIREARQLASGRRLQYLLLVLACLSVPWLALSGRDAEAEEELAEARRLAQASTIPQSEDGITGCELVLRIYQQDAPAIAAGLQKLADRTPMPPASS